MTRRERGEGSLYQAKDKSWVYQYNVDGKRKTKRFRRKADAKAFMEALTAGPAEIVVEKPSAGPRQVEPVTVGEWMDRWLEKYAKPTVKLSTYCSYEQLIRSHVKPHDLAHKLAEWFCPERNFIIFLRPHVPPQDFFQSGNVA